MSTLIVRFFANAVLVDADLMALEHQKLIMSTINFAVTALFAFLAQLGLAYIKAKFSKPASND